MTHRTTVPPARDATTPDTTARDATRGYRIALVCLGNICRSPMAEVVLRKRLAAAELGETVRVDSYGLGPWHVDEPMDRRARRTLREHGYDGDGHRARQIQRHQVGDHDLLLAMDSSNLSQLRTLAEDEETRTERIDLFGSFAGSSASADVPDPYYAGGGGFHHVLALVEEASAGLVTALAQHSSLRR